MRTRLPLALLVLVACSACTEQEQEAEPLHTSVPVGLALAVVGFGTLAVVTRWAWRQASVPGSRLQYPRGTAALVLAPSLLVGLALVGVVSWTVAFGYREPRTDVYSWDGWLTIAAWVGGAMVVVHLVAAAVAVAVTSPSTTSRVLGRVTLLVLVVGTAWSGLGLVWLPGLVASLIAERPPVEAAVTQPSLSSKR